MVQMIGITERGDPAIDGSWKKWVNSGKPAILVTKNFPKVFAEAGQRNNVVYHATVTGYGGTIYEPNVPSVKEVFDALTAVTPGYRDHVVVRIDPVVPTRDGIILATMVYSLARKNGYRTRVSILDLYPQALKRLENIEAVAREEIEKRIPDASPDFRHRLADISDRYHLYRELTYAYYRDGAIKEHLPVETRREILQKHFPEATVCGEPGLESVGCVSEGTCGILGVEYVGGTKGQRSFCPCGAQKFELLKKAKRCQHGCWYCFWKD